MIRQGVVIPESKGCWVAFKMKSFIVVIIRNLVISQMHGIVPGKSRSCQTVGKIQGPWKKYTHVEHCFSPSRYKFNVWSIWRRLDEAQLVYIFYLEERVVWWRVVRVIRLHVLATLPCDGRCTWTSFSGRKETSPAIFRGKCINHWFTKACNIKTWCWPRSSAKRAHLTFPKNKC